MKQLESIDNPKFKTLEKEKMKKVLGGVIDTTLCTIGTSWADGTYTLDGTIVDDSPPPPQWS